jgi:hypothetical protein
MLYPWFDPTVARTNDLRYSVYNGLHWIFLNIYLMLDKYQLLVADRWTCYEVPASTIDQSDLNYVPYIDL